MARGTTLLNLRAMLNAELGNSTAANTPRDAELNVLLSNKQKWLATELDWPFLERRWDVSVTGQFTTLPTVADLGLTAAIDLERMPLVEVKWNTKYQKVAYGIGEDEYNTMDVALGQKSDPVQRWRLCSNPNDASNANAFEVWPVPVTGQTIRFTGQRALLPLAVDADTADLDDMLLVYAVAAEKLTRAKQADAQLKLQATLRRLGWTKQNYPTREKVRCMGGGSGEQQFKKDRRIVGLTIGVR